MAGAVLSFLKHASRPSSRHAIPQRASRAKEQLAFQWMRDEPPSQPKPKPLLAALKVAILDEPDRVHPHPDAID